ncbi:MAG: hypothetical protein ICV73_06040 [Acetobacteraceae bacterium]|nr:hypothetical protein [Acetobacteraceae bacterium]
MSRKLLMPAAGAWLLALAAAAGPGLASPCTDQIDALERRLDETARAAASASSGGQGVAAAREGQAMQARDQNRPVTPPPAMPFQSSGQEAQATQQAAEAGGGGDRVMQARATLNRARSLEGQGNGAGCMEAVNEARRQLGN